MEEDDGADVTQISQMFDKKEAFKEKRGGEGFSLNELGRLTCSYSH